MNLLVKNPYFSKKKGEIKIISTNDNRLKNIGFSLLRLNKGESFSLLEKYLETVVVIMTGSCVIKCIDKNIKRIFKRKNYIKDMPSAFYVPLNEGVIIDAIKDTEISLCYSKTKTKKKIFIIEPHQVNNKIIGKNGYKRIVRDIVNLKNDTSKLLIGETISVNGNWSSFPPHKHDRDISGIESKFEEIYHYRLEPPQGRALQNIYTEDKKINETYSIENYDTVIIPKGYHPVVGYPGYKLYYLWILGGGKRNGYRIFEDEKHSWIKNASLKNGIVKSKERFC